MGHVLVGERSIPYLFLVTCHDCQCKVSTCVFSIYLYLSLLLLREMIVESGSLSPVELQSLLVPLPEQLTVDDIPDFFSLAQYYASRTPQSFRKVYLK